MDAAGIIAITGSACTLLGVLGGGVTFIWRRVELRLMQVEAKLEKCEARDRTNGERRALQIAVIRMLISAIESVSPANSVTTQAHMLLNDAMVTDAVATAATEADALT